MLVFATVPRGDMDMVRGTPRRHRSSSFGARWFCSDCGTQLYMQVDAEPATTDVTVASLDTPEALPPGFHIWDAARIPWFDTADTLERFAQARPQDG